jgi:hypothetical protein
MNSFTKHTFAIAAFMVIAAACSMLDNPLEDDSLQNGKHVSKMVFKGAVAGYEGTTLRDANTKGTEAWSDGDLVYIAFYNGTAIIPGTAVYSATDGWSVSYDGDLAEGSSQKCEVRYFVNTTFANENLVTLNINTEIYEDIAGSFDYNDGMVTVSASLTPKVGRIRFTGNAGDKIYVTGITTNTTFSPANNNFSTTAAMIPLDVEASGSTPYVYGFFTYEDRKIGLVGSDFAFTRTCGSSVFQTGESGYMKIPSKSSHNNWKTGLTITVNGVDFKMLPVAGFSGGFFLLAETETTNTQIKAVTGSSINANTYPSSTDWSNWNSFVTNLNYKTSLKFYIPSKEEWQFAAAGGSLSQGYTYSGSNTPGDVAWYAGNSGGQSHEVKQLAPNELGFYDMSGNVGEWTSTTTSGNSYKKYIMGGNYSSAESGLISSTDEYFTYYNNNNVWGLRLALKCE